MSSDAIDVVVGLRALGARGVEVTLGSPGKLLVRPADLVTAEDRDFLTTHKPAIVALLTPTPAPVPIAPVLASAPAPVDVIEGEAAPVAAATGELDPLGEGGEPAVWERPVQAKSWLHVFNPALAADLEARRDGQAPEAAAESSGPQLWMTPVPRHGREGFAVIDLDPFKFGQEEV